MPKMPKMPSVRGLFRRGESAPAAAGPAAAAAGPQAAVADAAPHADAASGQRGGYGATREPDPFFGVRPMPTHRHARVERWQLNKMLKAGTVSRLTYNRKKILIFERVSDLALRRVDRKVTDIRSYTWSAPSYARVRSLHVDLSPLAEREVELRCTASIYDYTQLPQPAPGSPAPLVVDFANKHIGGGCFSGGFVQEEQMVAQSTDFALRLGLSRDTLGNLEAATFDGIHMDAWWDRAAAAKKEGLSVGEIRDVPTGPLTILAVNACKVPGAEMARAHIDMLATKIALTYAIAGYLNTPVLFTGLLGGGAFRNNRPLILLLHMLLLPPDAKFRVVFHHPVFARFADLPTEALEERIVIRAEQMRERLAEEMQGTEPKLETALACIAAWRLPTSNNDADLSGRTG